MDLDYPLYKYWIFYKFNNSLNTKQLLIQKLKVFSIFIIILLNIFRYAFYLYQSEPNKLLPMNYGDLLQYIMPNKEFGYILVNALQSMSSKSEKPNSVLSRWCEKLTLRMFNFLV